MKRVKFNPDDLQNAMAKLNDKEINELMYGAVQLDAKGTILSYNQAESELTGRKPEDVIGRNFFEDVAPCTHTSEFSGRFFEGVHSGSINAMFDYIFDYQMKPTKVRVIMVKSLDQKTYWLLIKRILMDN